MGAPARQDTEWRIESVPVPYPTAVAFMEERAAAIREGEARELVWLLEHPPLYSAGTSADPKELLQPNRLPVFQTGRGGRYTYHGPGQRVVYVMLDLKRRGTDIRRFVWSLEEWIVRALATFNIKGERRTGRVGIWVPRDEESREDKIAAIGVRIRRWVSYHGIAINVDPDLSHFDAILPCGIAEHGVTSMVDLGLPVGMTDLDVALWETFPDVFSRGPEAG